MIRHLLFPLCLRTMTPALGEQGAGDPSPVVVYESMDEYELVRENLELAIIERGLRVRGVSDIGDMLERTGKDLVFEETVYGQAQSIEFCSASMTYRATALDPRNIAMCSYSIAVYTRAADPRQVYVAFRRPRLMGDSVELEAALFELLDGIVRDALE